MLSYPLRSIPDPTELTAMLRIKFEKFSKDGETFWQLSIPGVSYGCQIKRSSAELIKHPGFYNDRRTGVARDILIARRRLRDLFPH